MKKAAQFQCWALGGLALALMAMAGWSQSPDKEAPIRLTIKVPDPNATLFVDDTATRQKGETRYFESPPVPTGKKYSYTLKVTWLEGGKEKSRSRKVRVDPGKENNIDLTKEKDETKVLKDKKLTDVTDKKRTDKKTTDLFDKDLDKGRTDKDKKIDGKSDKATKDAPAPLDLPSKGDAKKSKNGNNKKPNPDDDKESRATPRTREFLFTYGATVTGLKPGQTARVWVPVPPSNEDQRVRMVPREQAFRG